MRNLARELTCRHGRFYRSCPVCKAEGHVVNYRRALATRYDRPGPLPGNSPDRDGNDPPTLSQTVGVDA